VSADGASSTGKQNQKMDPRSGLDVAPMVPANTFICRGFKFQNSQNPIQDLVEVEKRCYGFSSLF
jgi:hypothetical protein